jgi:hypothetical protein
MTDKRLLVFKAVADLNSFTKAAERVHITQPAVTFQIRELEQEIGMLLFNRERNTIAITEAGKVVLKCAEQVEDAYAKMREGIAKLQTSPKPQPWKPTSVHEADTFHGMHCVNCKLRPKSFGVACGIWRTAEMYDVADVKYPTEWQYTDEGKPVCTAYQVQ